MSKTNSFYELGRYIYLTYRMEDLAVQNNDNTIGHELFDLNDHYYDISNRYLEDDVWIDQDLEAVLHEAMSRYADAFRSMHNASSARQKKYGRTRDFLHSKAGNTLMNVDEMDFSAGQPDPLEMAEVIKGYNEEVREHEAFFNNGQTSRKSSKPSNMASAKPFMHQPNSEFEGLSDLRQRAYLALFEMKEVLRNDTFEDRELMELAGVDASKSWARGNFVKTMMWLDENDFIAYNHNSQSFDEASVHADVGNPYAYENLVGVDTNLTRMEVSALRVLFKEGLFLSQVALSNADLAKKMGTSRGGHVSDTMRSLEIKNWIRMDTTTSPYTFVPVQTKTRFFSEFGSRPSASELSNSEMKVAALKSFFHETDRPQPSDNDLAEMIEEEIDTVEDSVSRLSDRGFIDQASGDVLTPISLEGVSIPVSLESLKNFV